MASLTVLPGLHFLLMRSSLKKKKYIYIYIRKTAFSQEASFLSYKASLLFVCQIVVPFHVFMAALKPILFFYFFFHFYYLFFFFPQTQRNIKTHVFTCLRSHT